MKPAPLFIGRGMALKPELWAKGLSPSGRVILVSQPRIWELHGRKVLAALRREGLEASRRLLARGEKAKSWKEISKLLAAMLERGLDRGSALVALGGGSVTDASGFAAAIYMRGIPWVSMPTTLLGQIDGGIGGKTGIDLEGGKNLAGAFHPPFAVVCDAQFLDTLPRRERNSGLAEAIKFSLVRDPKLWRWICGHWEKFIAADEAVVRRAAIGKSRLVRRDPQEAEGLREILNFGHTIGHALESAAGLGPLRHGEAVLCGMRAALRLSRKCAMLSTESAESIDSVLRRLPAPRMRLKESAVLAALRKDKKARQGRLRFVLLKGVGRPVVQTPPEREIREAVRFILGEMR